MADAGSAGRISIRDLSMQVDGARLIDGINLDVAPGEVVGLIGPNGAGKSSLLRSIAGVGSGRSAAAMTLDSQDLMRMGARDIARRLAFVSQAAPDTHGFTGLEVVLTGRYPHLRRMEVEGTRDRDIALEAMARTATGQFADRDAVTLSGGERQRVFLARALAQAGEVLLLDEPTASLDVLHQFAVFELAREVAERGVAVIAAVHDLRLAARCCDRLVLMRHGRVVAEGRPSEVLTPDSIAETFGVRATVHDDPVTGHLAIEFSGPVPAERSRAPRPRVHVICGGGSGSGVMRDVANASFDVTAGPLGEGDVDLLTARSLGIPCLPHPSFAAIDASVHRKHAALVAEASAVVLCDVDFGANNLCNLEAASGAQRLLCVHARPISERDFTGGRAAALYAELSPEWRCAADDQVVARLNERFGCDEVTSDRHVKQSAGEDR